MVAQVASKHQEGHASSTPADITSKTPLRTTSPYDRILIVTIESSGSRQSSSASRQTENAVLSDHSPPILVNDDEAAQHVEKSTIPVSRLLLGKTAADEIELAFSAQGCGAVLVRLDDLGDLYDTFYRLQWQLGSRAFDSAADNEDAAARFADLDSRVRLLACQCAVAVARARMGIAGATALSLADLTKLAPSPLSAAVGRPLVANRQEFHASVDWLIEQAETGRLQREENPAIAVVADANDRERKTGILGRVQADEAQLLALYYEWDAASPEERLGHGNKYNGNIYYGAFRGRTHVDGGSTMTVLFGPGEVRDRCGRPADGGANRRQYGGTLIVKTPAQEKFTPLPYRLPCGSPYLVLFFNGTDGVFDKSTASASDALNNGKTAGTSVAVSQHSRAVGISTKALGWAASIHGVTRIEDTGFSRGQTVVLLRLTYADLV